MTLRFSVEPFRSVWEDVDRIGRQHWAETEGYHSGQQYNPDWKRYFSSDEAGWYFVATARDDTGRMVGYVGMWTMPSMHSQAMVAMEDFFFLEAAYRCGWNASRFLRFAEKECARRGCVEIGFTDKKGKGLILERAKYKVVAQQYSKNLHHPAADSGSEERLGASVRGPAEPETVQILAGS